MRAGRAARARAAAGLTIDIGRTAATGERHSSNDERPRFALASSHPKTEAFSTYDVLGVPVSVTTLAMASRTIEHWARDNVGRFVCVRDVHGIMRARDDIELKALHHDAAMVTPDGMPLVWLGRRAGH